MAKVELKQPIIQEISEKLDGAQCLVVVNYQGLTVAQDTELRKALREAGVSYKIYKNTYVRRAVEGTAFESIGAALEGPNAFASSKEDATAPARVIADFVKKNKIQKLEMVAGVVDGKFCDAAQMQAVAEIPSKEVLIGRLLGSMQSPITNFARVLKQIAEPDEAPAEA